MPTSKELFVEALQALPEDLGGFLDTKIPNFADVVWPTDTDSAILANGQLAYNVNLLLQQFSGLPLIELVLRIGQHNPTPQAYLLSSLEFLGKSQHAFSVTSPAAGTAINIASPILVGVMITDGIEHCYEVSCVVTETGQKFNLDRSEGEKGRFSKQVQLDNPDQYALLSCVFTARFNDTSFAPQQTIGFEVYSE